MRGLSFYDNMEETALLSYFVLNDTLHSVCDFNPFLFEKGISIYEVIRVEEGIPLFLQEHMDRFFGSAVLIQKNIRYSGEEIRSRLKTLISENKFVNGNIKFLNHWNEAGQQQFMAWIVPFFYPSAEQYQTGVKVGHMVAERPNPNSKTALYELRKEAAEFVRSQQCFEVAYVSKQGWLTEGSKSNLFFIANDQLYTPETSLVLPGVTRAKLMEIAYEHHVRVLEPKIMLHELDQYEACFLSSTSARVMPVKQMGTVDYDVNHPLLRFLMKAYLDICQENLNNFSW